MLPSCAYKKALALAFVVNLVVSTSATAGFKLRISDGKKSLTILDNQLNDLDGSAGGIQFQSAYSGMFSNFDLGIIAISKAQINQPIIDLSSISVNALSRGTLVIELTQTGFTLPATSHGDLTSSINILGMNGVSATFQSWVNYGGAGNNEFGTTGSKNNYVSTPGLQSLQQSLNLAYLDSAVPMSLLGPNNPFSLTSRLVLQFGGSGSFTSASGISTMANPEPATIISALAGLPVLAVWWRRRQNSVRHSIAI